MYTGLCGRSWNRARQTQDIDPVFWINALCLQVLTMTANEMFSVL